MKLCEVLDLVPKGQKKHKEIKYPNMLDKTNWGEDKTVQTRDVVIKSSDGKAIYGRRTIVQRGS
jgi:hypothetical protein